MRKWGVQFRVTRNVVLLLGGLYFMNQIVTYGANPPPIIQAGVLWMIGLPLADFIDILRVALKERKDDEDDESPSLRG